jgi:arginine N-succinyltransferase
MFFVRPIARDDLPAVLALSERTGHGLTTLPADRDRLSSRIERSLASPAGTASRRRVYVFVLVDSTSNRVVKSRRSKRRGRLRALVQLPCRHDRACVARSVGVHGGAHAVSRERSYRPHQLCSLFLDQAYRHAKNGPLLAKAGSSSSPTSTASRRR